MPASILVWSDRPALALELVGEARRLGTAVGGEIGICVSGAVSPSELDLYAVHGADVVYATDNRVMNASESAALLVLAIARSQPTVVLVGATKTGMEVGPRVVERCQASYAAWAVSIEIDSDNAAVTASCMLYAGNGLAKHRFLRPVTVLSVGAGIFEEFNEEGRTARLDSLVVEEEPSRPTVTAEKPKPTSGSRLQEAKTVVDVGRGVKKIEDLKLLGVLAELLDGQLSCSRPVSSDRDWFPEWIGLSGAKVKPELCLAVGISGAIQHVVGIRDSRVIACINNDEDAAIFAQADIGVVADLDEFLPVLVERLRERDARPVWM
ncbi:MAG: electron transfer flavoprotein subunit alpha/FixB family protein [Acidimicrobiales bacterium]|jgi:electron transfer flavoprotein alpha subunit